MSPLNWKLRWLPGGHFGLFTPLNQETKKALTVLGGVTDPEYLRETGFLLHDEGKEEYVSNTEDPLGHLLVLPSPVRKVNGKQQQPYPGRTTDGPDPSGMKVWVNPPPWVKYSNQPSRLLKAK